MNSFLQIALDLLLGFVRRCVLAGVGGVELVQFDLGVRFDAKLFAVVHRTSCCFSDGAQRRVRAMVDCGREKASGRK